MSRTANRTQPSSAGPAASGRPGFNANCHDDAVMIDVCRLSFRSASGNSSRFFHMAFTTRMIGMPMPIVAVAPIVVLCPAKHYAAFLFVVNGHKKGSDGGSAHSATPQAATSRRLCAQALPHIALCTEYQPWMTLSRRYVLFSFCFTGYGMYSVLASASFQPKN